MSDNRTGELTKSWLDCFHERRAICPYCGYEDEDSCEYEEGDTETECPACGEPYIVNCEIVVEYTTSPIGGWPDD